MSDKDDKSAQDVAKEQHTRVWNQWDDEVAAELQAEFGEGINDSEEAKAAPTTDQPVIGRPIVRQEVRQQPPVKQEVVKAAPVKQESKKAPSKKRGTKTS